MTPGRFMSITGADSGSALQFLEVVNLYLESGGQSDSTSFAAPREVSQASSTTFSSSSSARTDMDAVTAAAIAARYGEECVCC
ncbi:hypothetical protein PsorP6_011561 [Peronosclerospora sorghi]|uniref:Uncharacterized protein n=1 Tax=Peronosclerospora sorghi TaxID=230839 RepID=A0ACC0WKZ1_9STRA|nr:hypothetical protein PsorP6_011561 [Peronosclerospora sorghi]